MVKNKTPPLEKKPSFYQNIVDYIKNLAFFVFIYGLGMNYAFAGVFNIPFSWYTFPAWGLLFFFIKTEYVPIFRSIFVILRQSAMGR